MARKKWTETEIEELKKDYGVLSCIELENKYNHPYESIRAICSYYNISNLRKKKWTIDKEKDFMLDYQNNDNSIEYIMNKYDSTESAVRTKARDLGVKRQDKTNYIKDSEILDRYKNGESINKISKDSDTPIYHITKAIYDTEDEELINRINNKKYLINERYFEQIDTQEKAYWFGFLMADGCNREYNNTVAITLQHRDYDTLVAFRNAIGSPDRKIVKKEVNGRFYSTISVSNRVMSSDLAKHGMVQNKTFKIVAPDISEHLVSHFIRGYFDGDGHIGVYSKGRIQLSILGTESLMLWIKNIFEANIDELNVYFSKAKKNSKIYQIRVGGGNKVESVMEYLYKDSVIHMQRKYDKYIEVKNRSKDIWKTRRELYNNKGHSIITKPYKMIDFLTSLDDGIYAKKDVNKMFDDSITKYNFGQILNSAVKLYNEDNGIKIKTIKTTNRKVIISTDKEVDDNEE